MKPLPLAELIAALSDPAAYSHPVRNLHVVQTHASCVFLTGDYVYKVKKPVDFGFLDYSTLERRRECCDRELELNRRLCPEVYLDVLPIGWEEGRLRIGASGPAVEWAVRMRQLPEEDLLPARLAAGSVSTSDLERVAAVLAAFHGAAETGAEINAFGTADAVARNVEENFTETEGRIGDVLPLEHLVTVRDYSRGFLAEHAALFERRSAGGRIRDGHGDLRAQNLGLHAGLGTGVQIFDCIEFNDRFRYSDVAADLAYLAMDLELAGRSDLRRALVDRYVALSGDPELRRVLPFYCCYRAYVRGKIALLAAEEAEIPAAERQAHRELAAAAFDLARSYAEARDHPLLLVMVGYSGSGKSVLARELARRLPAVRLASDEVRKEQAGVPHSTRLGGDAYAAESRAGIYEELHRRAAGWLSRGEDVLLDATFLAREERERAARLAAEHGAVFRVVECRCPEAVIRQRLRERAGRGDASDADEAVLAAQLRSAKIPLTPGEGWIRVRTDQPASQSARDVLQILGTPRHGASEREP